MLAFSYFLTTFFCKSAEKIWLPKRNLFQLCLSTRKFQRMLKVHSKPNANIALLLSQDQQLLTQARRQRVIVVCLCVCLSVQLDLRDCLIWRQFEHSDGKVSSSSAKDMCGFLKNISNANIALLLYIPGSTIIVHVMNQPTSCFQQPLPPQNEENR